MGYTFGHGLYEGIWEYNATFRESADYYSVSTEPKTFEVKKLNVNLIISVDDIKVGEIAKLEGQLTNPDGVGMAYYGVILLVNGTEHRAVTDADGKFSYDVEGLAAGQYIAYANYAGDGMYPSAFNSTVFNVKAEPELNVSIANIKEGEDAVISVTLYDGETPLNGVVEVSISGFDDPFIVAVAEGSGTLEVSGLTEGTYTYNASSLATSDYSSVSTDAKTFEVTKEPVLNVDISVDGDNIIVKVTDEEGNPVDGAKVNVTLDGETKEYTVDKGTVTIPTNAGGHDMSISTGEGKELIVKVYTTGDVKPAPASKIGTAITIGHTTIPTYNKAINSKAKSYVLVTLKDANGKTLANKAFQFIYQGKTYKYTTDAKGQKKINILSASKGTVGLAVVFEGDSQYSASFKAAAVKINPQKVKIVAKKKTFKAKKKVIKYTVTLKNSKGKAIKGKKLVLVIKKKKYTAKTNKKGKATFKIKKLKKKGTYKVKVEFAGDKTYKKITKKSKIKIK